MTCSIYSVDLLSKRFITKHLLHYTNQINIFFQFFYKISLAMKSLNFLSPKANKYVKATCLPHPKALAKWYSHMNKPGFSDAAFITFKEKTAKSYGRKSLCSLIADKNSIRCQSLWDGKKNVGYVDMGSGPHEERRALATKACLFRPNGINDTLKLPLGHALVHTTSALQSAKVKPILKGIVPPVFTPLYEDGTINYSLIPPYAKYIADTGVKGILVGGTTGENMSLNMIDRKHLVEEWLKQKQVYKFHVMVQVGGAPLADVVELAAFCSRIGVDSLMTLPELYFRPKTVEELVHYVGLVASAAPNLPVFFYHIPYMTQVMINMPAFVTAATAKIPNFRGIKFTNNDLEEGAQVLRNLKEGQDIYLGADTLLGPAALLGITSSVGITFNLWPRLTLDIVEAVKKNEAEKSRKIQEKLSLAIEAHNLEGLWVPVMKAGMEIMTGFKFGPPILPLKPICNDAKNRIAKRMKALGLLK